jgi:tetratricopeptide (TPR) repeat protein
VYEELLHTHPEHPVILNNAANLYIDINDLERADELAQRALINAPNEPLVLDTVGWIAAQKGELELSLSLLRQAETLKYNDPTISGHIVDVLIRMGRFDEAQRAQNDE